MSTMCVFKCPDLLFKGILHIYKKRGKFVTVFLSIGRDFMNEVKIKQTRNYIINIKIIINISKYCSMLINH